MLFEMNSTEIPSGGIKTTRGKKEIQCYAIAIINIENAFREIERTSLFKNLVAYKFEGTVQELADLEEVVNKGKKPILYSIHSNGIDASLGMDLHLVPQHITPVVHLPEEYSDLRSISNLVEQIPRVRIEGGTVLRLPELNLGMVSIEDIPKKINEMTLPYRIKYMDGNSAIKKVPLTLLDDLEFYDLTMKEILTEEEKEARRQSKKLERVRAKAVKDANKEPKASKPKQKAKPKPKKPTSAMAFFQ